VRTVRYTIEAMCLGIALLAIDIVIWKTDLSGNGVWVMVGMRGTLIASSVFIFALAYLLTGRGSRLFLVGFLAAGLFTELAYWVCCWAAPWQVLAYAQNSVDKAVFGFYFDNFPGFYRALLEGSPSARLFFDMTCFPLIVTIDSLPLLSVAVLGGWALKRRGTRCQWPRRVTT
jgi:hypothetical protein